MKQISRSRKPSGEICENVPDSGQDHTADGNDSFLVTTTSIGVLHLPSTKGVTSKVSPGCCKICSVMERDDLPNISEKTCPQQLFFKILKTIK